MTSSSENSIRLVDALSGEEKKKVNCRSTGVEVTRFTHHELCLLVASQQRSCDVRHLSLYDNRFLRSFQGHQDLVVSMSMSPVDDTFITASLDKTVRKWDLSSPNEVASISLPSSSGAPYTSFDSSGLIFGVMTSSLKDNTHSIRLFDARQHESGPFQVISPAVDTYLEVLAEQQPSLDIDSRRRIATKSMWTSFQFSTDGNNILVNTDSDLVWLLDGYRPDMPPKVVGPRRNEAAARLAACISTDCNHVLLGSEDNEIQVFNMTNRKQVATLPGHVASVSSIAFNPVYDMFASGCINTALWIPKG